MPNEQTGWLAGLRDRFVGRALTLLHGKPAHSWTVEELAREVGLSRSSFAEQFMHLVGQPPMQYLTAWRMQIAVRMLSDGVESVAKVARGRGLQSEAAFNRTFKKLVGTPRRRGATNGGRQQKQRSWTPNVRPARPSAFAIPYGRCGTPSPPPTSANARRYPTRADNRGPQPPPHRQRSAHDALRSSSVAIAVQPVLLSSRLPAPGPDAIIKSIAAISPKFFKRWMICCVASPGVVAFHGA